MRSASSAEISRDLIGFFSAQAPQCEHAFCSGCIHEWLTRQPSCPVDRNNITPNQLKPVPRITRNLLSRLYINCDNASFGCTGLYPAVMCLPNNRANCAQIPLTSEISCAVSHRSSVQTKWMQTTMVLFVALVLTIGNGFFAVVKL